MEEDEDEEQVEAVSLIIDFPDEVCVLPERKLNNDIGEGRSPKGVAGRLSGVGEGGRAKASANAAVSTRIDLIGDYTQTYR